MSLSACPKCGAPLGPSRVHGEGPWNQGWRAGLDQDQQFVNINGLVADVVARCGTIIELQYGPMARHEIIHREQKHGNLAWLFHACDAHAKGRLRLLLTPGKQLARFKWTSPRETIDACNRDVYLDLGPSDQANGVHLVLKLGKTYPDGRTLLGNGTLVTGEDFHDWMAHGSPLRLFIPGVDDHVEQVDSANAAA
ncbi:hypothetical protein ABZX98_07335 [Streptomyces sp. NPDC002992]|uniref:hypothetical protein n=1 Tax=Streptomyces sp. NPDC002992 TaxID=3154273 RepID=UPI0033A3BDE1